MKLDKEIYEKIINSDEFIRWFGDWKHPDRNTSKIVGKDGKPLVVYHGSPYKFAEFKYDINSTSGQYGADYAFWFSDNYKVAKHFSSCYPKSFYDKKDIVRDKYDKLIKKDKIDFLKSLDKNGWYNLLTFIGNEYGKSTGYYNLEDYVKNENWDEIDKILINLLFFVGKKHINEIFPKLSDYINIEKKYESEMEKELDIIQNDYDNQNGYIYPVFIKATIIEEENGENVGIGLNRIPDNNIHCKIIRNADTGSVFADEYVVTNPKRIKIATGENFTFNNKSKNIYEKHIITKFKLFEFHEENLNKILDKISKQGIKSLTDSEKKILQNNGEILDQKHFEKNDIVFDVESTEDFGKSIKVNGIITYQSKQYKGYFQFEKDGGNDPMSYIHHFDDFEPEDDDFYDLDDLTQEVESVFAN